MMGRSHATIGATVGAWLAAAGATAGVPDGLAALAVPVAAYAALLPDLDHPRTTATRSLVPITMAVSFVLRRFVDHRGATHDPRSGPVAAVALAAPAAWLPAPVGGWAALWWLLVILAGWTSHIWADARTLSGTPWPGRRGRLRVAGFELARTTGGRLRIGRSFRTGSRAEEWRLTWIYVPTMIVSVFLAALVVRNG
jgi:membrane-bound metal-dependent hydrolase YbcI (DUF457 family)